MFKRISFIAMAIVILFSFQSCNDDENGNTSTTSRLQLVLVDGPGDYEQVNIEIIDILYNSSNDDGGWVSLGTPGGEVIKVDLTTLVGGQSLLLTDEMVPSGTLDQIRLVLNDNNTLKLEEEEELIHLDTPSAQQSGLKIKLNTELVAGYSYNFILDWDVEKSIVKAGNSGKYNLKPVIRVNAELDPGAIKGSLIEKDGEALIDVLIQLVDLSDVEIATTLTDENGDFMIHGLSEGSYMIKIAEENYDAFTSSEIVVELGKVTDVGVLELVLTL